MIEFNPDVAEARVRLLASAGPTITPVKGRAIVADLRAGAKRAPELIADLTGLTGPAGVAASAPVKVVARPAWARGAAESASLLAGGVLPESNRFSARIASEELGAALAFLAPKILGQYDPFAKEHDDLGPLPEGRLLLVAPNIHAFEQEWDLDARDVRLWVCVHELTHAVQFAAAPWLRGYVTSRIQEGIKAFEDSATDSAKETLDELMILMSVLEGHAQYVMNNVPVAVMPSVRRIKAAMSTRRSSGNVVSRWLKERLGLTAKHDQYEEGDSFTSGVVEQGGHELFNRIFESPHHLPSREELSHPARWVRRIGD